MDKIAKYQNIVISILEYYANLRASRSSDVESQFITDKDHHHYIILNVGWRDMTPVYNATIHIDIKEDGKVWVQQDWTDAIIVDELIEKGVEPSDIVLGFLAPYKRPYVNLATM